MEQLLELLNSPLLVALVTPTLVKLLTTALETVGAVVPKPVKPLLAIALGALSSAIGDVSAGAGALAGLTGVGIRETAKPVSKAVAATVKGS